MFKNSAIKILWAIILFFVLILSFNFLVKAEGIEISYKFSLDLKDGLHTSIGKLILTIKDNDDLQIVDKYSITIPIQNAENVLVTLGGNVENNFTITEQNSYKTVNVTFEKPVLPGETKDLIIQFTSPILLRSSYGIKQLYIQNPFDNLSKNITYEIQYPKTFGNIYRSYNDQEITELNQETNQIKIESRNGIYIVWADKIQVNLKSYAKLKNDNEQPSSFLFNLPPSSNRQKVFFNELKNIDDGLNDLEGNLLGEVSLEPKSEEEIGYSADVFIENKEVEEVYFNDYNFIFDSESAFGKEVLENTKDLSDNYSKFQMFNQILRSRVSPNKQASILYDDFNNIWQKLNSNSTLNSFEYAALNISFADYLGLKGRLEYGYIILSPIEMDLSRPQVWAVVDIDGRHVFIDAFMEDLSNISYFDINYIDRVKFGIWHPSQSYNPAAGLAYESNSIRIEANPIENKEYNTDFSIDVSYPESVASGSFYNADLNINNTSNMALMFQSLLINDANLLGQIRLTNGLYPAILPSKSEKVSIENLKESNLFASYSQNISTKIKFEGIDVEVMKDNMVSFYIDLKNIILFIVIFALSVSVLGFLFLKLKAKLVGSK